MRKHTHTLNGNNRNNDNRININATKILTVARVLTTTRILTTRNTPADSILLHSQAGIVVETFLSHVSRSV